MFSQTLAKFALMGSLGYFASLGLVVNVGDLQTAIQDPMSIEWKGAGETVMKVGLAFRQDAIEVVEGPVTDFVNGARGVFFEHIDEFAVEIPDTHKFTNRVAYSGY